MFPRFRYISPASSASARAKLRVLGTTDMKTSTSTALGLYPFTTDVEGATSSADVSTTYGSTEKVRVLNGRIVRQVPTPESFQSLTLRSSFASKRVLDAPGTELGKSATCAVPDALAADSSYLGKLIAPHGYTKFLQVVRIYGGSITKLSTDSFDTDPVDTYVVAVDRCCAAHASTVGATVPPVFALTMPTSADGIAAVREAWVELLTSWAADWTVRRVRTRSQVGPNSCAVTGTAPTMYGSTRTGFPFAATGFAAAGAMLSLAIGYSDRRSGAVAAAITAALSAPALITRSNRSLYDVLALKAQWHRSAMKGHHVISPRTAEAGTR